MNSTPPLRIVIIGGVAGGASAATRARRMNSDAEITIVEKGPVVSFANCGLPYHIGGEIENRNKLLVASKELFWNRFRISVLTDHEAIRIDRDNRTIDVLDRATNFQNSIPYDRLILATGSEPNTPDYCRPMPTNAFHLWTLADMDRIIATIGNRKVERAIVVGAGFVGLEVVEQLHRIGINVSLVERNPQVLTRLDPLFAKIVEAELKAKGVRLHLGVSIQTLGISDGIATSAQLSDQSTLDTDLLVIGAGVRPRIELAANAGLSIGSSGGVAVNDWLQTSDPNIYAVGDMIEYVNGVTGERTLNALAGPANRSGRIAGEHAARGNAAPMGAVFGTSIVRVFGLTAACTGLNEKQLRAKGISFRTAIIQAANHATYFPGSQSMQLKILYSPEDGKLLGAQSVGGEGVDKRIDVIATAMHFGGTVSDLAQLDLAYAPPFGSAKDPVHMAAFAATNDLSHHPTLIDPDTNLDGKQVVDVRTDHERRQLPLPGAIAIEVDSIPQRYVELDPNLPTVVVCHSAKRAHVAACWLKNLGFRDVVNLTGGMAIRSLIDPP